MKTTIVNTTAKVGYGAYDTWLEPYIGWEFPVVKVSKNLIWFLMDNGGDKLDVTRYDRKCFILKEEQEQLDNKELEAKERIQKLYNDIQRIKANPIVDGVKWEVEDSQTLYLYTQSPNISIQVYPTTEHPWRYELDIHCFHYKFCKSIRLEATTLDEALAESMKIAKSKIDVLYREIHGIDKQLESLYKKAEEFQNLTGFPMTFAYFGDLIPGGCEFHTGEDVFMSIEQLDEFLEIKCDINILLKYLYTGEWHDKTLAEYVNSLKDTEDDK